MDSLELQTCEYNYCLLGIRVYLLITVSFPVFPFDPPGNIRKPFVFRGIQREHWEEKG